MPSPKSINFMRISDRYIGRQVLSGTLYAVIVLGLVLVLGNLFKQIKPLLVDQKAPLELVIRFAINVLPVSLLYTIPWGFLTAVLLVFGRLSAGHEITSFRVAGLSLVRLAAPVFVIGAFLSLLSFWLNTTVVPNSKATVKQLIYEQAKRDPKSLLKPGVVQGDFKGDGDSVQKLLIESRDGDWVEGFHFYILPNVPEAQGAMTYIHAARAALDVDAERSQLRIKLENAYFESRNAKGEVEMAFAGEAEPLVIDLKNPKDRKPKASWMSNEQIRLQIANTPDMPAETKLKMRSEIMGRYSFSLACFAFAFVAVPLGLQTSRRDTSRGLILSLLIGAGYFLITTLADQVKSESAATAVLWSPNVACVLIGIFLFRRTRFR
jgi:lipopolysaccharide export system permease protein